jgi:hypothetical protein
VSGINTYPQTDFSLGVQAATTPVLRKPNEVQRGINLKFTEEVGGVWRKDGNEIVGDSFTTVDNNPPLGGHVAKFSTGSIRFVAVNNDAGDACIIRTQNSTTGAWTTLSTISYPPDAIIFFLDFLDEVFISGFDPVTGDPVQPFNVDKTLDVSATRNLLFCPRGYFFAEYLGLLYVANVKIGADRFTDRVYKGSPPLGAIGFVQTDQTDVTAPVTLNDQVPTMSANNAPFGVAFASSEINVANQAWYAFDDVAAVDHRWISNTLNAAYLGYDFGAGNAKVITYYSITAYPSGDASGGAPKDWTFEGSNDNSTWTVLHTQTAAAAWTADEKRTYSINNTTAYRYYRLNISNSQNASNNVEIAEMELLQSSSNNKDLQLITDSVRYIKPGMSLDVYKAGTDIKKYVITVATVDKPNNTFTFTPYFQNFNDTNVDTSTDKITLSDATQFMTGAPIKFDSTGTVPGGLTANTIYYSIFVDATHIKIATSAVNAQLGNAIDLTTTGSLQMRIRTSYVFGDNDELWLTGRKGKLTTFWNVDYPNAQDTGEFLALKPGTDSSNTISAIAKSSNRLFIWTKNSGTRWDGSNLVVFNNSVGCISQRSVKNLDDDWLIWVDAKGNVRARNESGAQQENISRPIRNKYLRKLTLNQLKAVSAGLSDSVYKLYLGTINGENIRVDYDFDANTWSPERLRRPALIAAQDDATGVIKPYFFSDNGNFYIDEFGNEDDGQSIEFEMGTGPDMLGTKRKKQFYGMLLFSQNCSGMKLEVSIDGGPFKTVGEVDGPVSYIRFPERGDNKLREGVRIDWQLMGSIPGDPQKVEAAFIDWIPREEVPGVPTN